MYTASCSTIFWRNIAVHLTVNGISTHYEISGPEDASVVVFSNSLLSNISMWDPQMDAFSDFRILRYDQRGHGDTEGTPGAYTFELLADDVRELMLALKIEQAHFVGLSMGGMTGQAMALYYPEMIRSLVLCDTRGHTPEARKVIREERIALTEREGVEPMVEGCIKGWFSDDFVATNPALMDEVRKMIRDTSAEGLIGCSYALNTHNYSPRLHEITCPTLIVVGEHDVGTPVSESQAMQECIVGSELVVLSKARHLSNMEQADLFNTEVTRFLMRLK